MKSRSSPQTERGCRGAPAFTISSFLLSKWYNACMYQMTRRKEILLIIGLSIVISLTTLIPQAIHSLTKYPDQVQTWSSTRSPWDTYTYISWIEQARQGHVLFKDLYSSEAQPRNFFHPIFILLGTTARLLSISSLSMYQLARVLSDIFLLLIMYKFIARIFDHVPIRILVWITAAVGSGLGLFIGRFSTDMWMTENNVYFGMYHTLLNNCSLALLLLLFMVWEDNIQRPNRRAGLISGALTLAIGAIHTYYIPLALIVTGLYALWSYRTQFKPRFILLNYAYLVTFSLIITWWQAHMLEQNPILGIWAFMQSNVPAPPILYYLAGLGLPLLFAVVGFAILRIEHRILPKKFILPGLWLVGGTLLLYNPFFNSMARKYSEGLQFAITIFAGVGIVWLTRSITTQFRIRKWCVYTICLVACTMTTVAWLTFDSVYNSHGLDSQYISVQDKQAMDWIAHHTEPKTIIASGKILGNVIPGATGRMVYYGHYDQTVNASAKLRLLQLTLTSYIKHTDVLKSFVRQEHVGYIIVDSEVQTWGGLFTYERNYLKRVYTNADVEIYQVEL